MGVFNNLSNNVTEIGVMVVTLVLISILLQNMKTTGACATGLVYNATRDACHLAANNSGGNASINSVGTNINTAITAIATPVTYVEIILLVIIFAAILVILVMKMRKKNSF